MSRHIMWQEPTLKNHLDVLLKPSIGILSGRKAPGYQTNDIPCFSSVVYPIVVLKSISFHIIIFFTDRTKALFQSVPWTPFHQSTKVLLHPGNGAKHCQKCYILHR